MEYINKIELQGKVGAVRARVVNDIPVQCFSLATEYFLTLEDGASCCEVCWHNVVAWDKTEVVKGDKVRVLGRMKQCQYCGTDGANRNYYEVVATEVEVIAHEDKPTQADAKRAEVRKALNDLVCQRMTEDRLNGKLSTIFGKEITVEQGQYDDDWKGDDYYTFNVDDEEIGGYFDIYYLKMNKTTCFYITEVNIYFE